MSEIKTTAGGTPASLSVWSLAWPTMLAMASHTATRWADMKMVGVLGEVPLAAVTVGGQATWLFQMAVIALSVGLTAIVARAYGAGRFDEVDQATRQAVSLSVVVSIVTFGVGLLLLEPIFVWIGTEAEVTALGAGYLFWMLTGLVPLAVSMQLASSLRAGGDAMTPLWLGLIANVLNVGLNWIFIYGHWGAPAMGAAGAGLASSLSLVVATLLLVFWWRKGWTILPITGGRWRLDFAMWRRIAVIGAPSAAEGVLFNVVMLAFVGLMAGYGTAELVAYQIGVQIFMLAFLPGHGFEVAASALVGQNLGAGRPEQAEREGWKAARMAMVFMIGMASVLFVASEPLGRFFIDSDEVIGLFQSFIIILALCMPMLAVDFAIGGALRGAGDTRTPMVALLVALAGFRLLPGYFIANVFGLDVEWLWSVLLVDFTVRTALLCWAFRRGKWKLKVV